MRQVGFSLEIFPPKSTVEISEIYGKLGEFAKAKPDFISVTYGAGGSTQRMTKEISREIQNKHNIPGVAHLTCVGATKQNIETVLGEFAAENITRILALRGDLPNGNANVLSDFRYASDLIEFIAKTGNFDVYAACYPEGHSESASRKEDIEVAVQKAQLGVKMFMSQLFYDNNDFFDMLEKMRAAGVKTPIHAGIMPLTNVKQILRIVTLSGAKLPHRLTKIVSRFENNPKAFYQAGLNYAVEQITELLSSGADGVHLYTMNNPDIAQYIYSNICCVLSGVNQ